MNATISKNALKNLSVEAFQALSSLGACFGIAHDYEFIEGGVQHKFMDANLDFIRNAKITQGVKFKLPRKLSPIHALCIEEAVHESFAGNKQMGYVSSNFIVQPCDMMSSLFRFLSKHAEHLSCAMAVYEDKHTTCERLDLYIESTVGSNEDKLRIWLTVDSTALDRLKSANTNSGGNPFPYY